MSRYRQTMSDLLKEVRQVKEQDKDHEISMARGELEAIADKATQLASMLQGKSDDGNPLEAWVQSKITKAKDYINSVSDYMTYNPDMKQNEELEEARFNVSGRVSYKGVGPEDDFEIIIDAPSKQAAEKKIDDMIYKARDKRQIGPRGGRGVEEYEIFDIEPTTEKVTNSFYTYQASEKQVEEGYSSDLVKKAKEIAKKFADNMTKAVDEIEKIKKGLSKDKEVYATLRQYNEESDRPKPSEPNPKSEGRMSDIDAMKKAGASAEEIAKKLKLPVNAVKDILGEDNEELYLDLLNEKISDNIIKTLQKSYADLKGKTISPEMANKLSKHLDQPSYDLDTLRQLVKANIPFVSTVARNKIYKKTGKFEGAKKIVETIQAVKNKAEKTGMPYSILKQVYDRGMAAWKGGHRPGATQVQWALARVNSFVTKSSGTWGGADSDLAAKVKGSKK